MEFSEFLSALKAEINLVEADLAAWLVTISEAADMSEHSAAEAVEAYGGQVSRLKDTSEMIGLAGVAQFCEHLQGVAASLASHDLVQRAILTAYLKSWPPLLTAYLDAPAEFEPAMTLCQYLAAPESPNSLSEEASLQLMEALSTPLEMPEEFAAEVNAADVPVQISPEDVSLAFPDDMDRDVYEAFMSEAPDRAGELSALVGKLARQTASLEEIREAKRLAHSFKGSASIVGIKGIASLAHHTEDILEFLETNPVTPPRPLCEVLMDSAATLEQMVYALLGTEEVPGQAYGVLQAVVAWKEKIRTGELTEVEEQPPPTHAPAASVFVPEQTVAAPASSALAGDWVARADVPPAALDEAPPRMQRRTRPRPAAAPSAPAAGPDEGAALRVPVRTVDDLFRLVSEMTIKIGQLETRLKESGQRSKALLQHNLAVQQRIFELEKLVMIRGLSFTKASADGDALDPLELDRYNELHSATRALVEVTADARELGLGIEDDLAVLNNEVVRQSRMNKDMQFLVMSTRMTPVSTLTPRLMRNVRQTCQSLGKEAELLITGGEILVDGDILAGLADPLLHILRNAIDHGIETPSERAALGKQPVGMVHMEVSRQGNAVVVHVRDDGRGLDYSRLHSKGIERGLLQVDARPSELELARLTLQPGFSTKDAVSEISGRGVGMDVVASRLQALKGSVDIRSVSGQGCEIQLRFQASLVSQHTLLVEVGGQTFGVPSHNLEQALSPGLGEFARVGNDWTLRSGRRVARVRMLTQLLGQSDGAQPVDEKLLATKVALLVAPTDGSTELVALMVDRVIDSRDLIIKNMGRYLKDVPGIAGCAILGNGVIAPLLDVAEWLRAPTERAQSGALRRRTEELQHKARVLVVDDSVSVRKSLSGLLRDFSFEVITAGDGMEAVRAMQGGLPDVLLTDLEMPNMNGIELVQHVRARADGHQLPIIMITSRSMDKHRQMAQAAGVDVYLTKPYTDGDLVTHVERAVALRQSQGQHNAGPGLAAGSRGAVADHSLRQVDVEFA